MALSLIILGFTLFFGYIYLMIRLDKKLCGGNEPAPDKPFDLTLLDKRDYDFLRTNGLEVDQKTHDHFYPPVQEYPQKLMREEAKARRALENSIRRAVPILIQTDSPERVRIVTPEGQAKPVEELNYTIVMR